MVSVALASLLLGSAQALGHQLRQGRQGNFGTASAGSLSSLALKGIPSIAQVEMGLGLLENKTDNEMLQAIGCYTIMGRTEGFSNGSWIADAGGVPLALRSMRSLSENIEVQFACAGALSGLSMGNETIAEAVGAGGGVELVLDAIRRFPKEIRMLKPTFQTYLLDISASNRERWRKAGGIELNLARLRQLSYVPIFAERLCWVFSTGTREPNTEAFVEAGGVELLTQIMKDRSQTVSGREGVMLAMKAVAANPKTRPALAKEGYILEVVRAMQESPMDRRVQSPGCANIAILAGASDVERSTAVEAGAAEAVLQALRAWPEMQKLPVPDDLPDKHAQVMFQEAQYTPSEDCTEALSALAPSADARVRLQSAGAGDVVRSLLEGQPQNARLQLAGTAFLRSTGL